MRFALALAACLVVAPAVAQQPPRPPERLQGIEGRDVWVWRDADAMAEGRRLIEAGINRTRPDMVVPLVACIVESGTAVIATGRARFGIWNVVVVDGPRAGCRGVVNFEAIVFPP
jgi:hypothetical protein